MAITGSCFIRHLFRGYTFTLGLWLNLLSSHLTTVPGPPNGMNGLICRSTEQIS